MFVMVKRHPAAGVLSTSGAIARWTNFVPPLDGRMEHSQVCRPPDSSV